MASQRLLRTVKFAVEVATQNGIFFRKPLIAAANKKDPEEKRTLIMGEI
jgi:hypothetical protein